MNVKEFLSTMDALRFDTSLDETNPELRSMVQKAYPYIRKIYNMMYESGLISESKVNESSEKWYVVDDGEVYNVLTEDEFLNGGYDNDQIVKVTNNMDMAFDYAEKLNRDVEEHRPDFSPGIGYFNESKVNEEHRNKKHKGPKSTLAAMRKGNREADQEMYGGGFRQTKKVHKAKNDYDRKGNKVDINNLDKYQNESKKISYNHLMEMIVESIERNLKNLK